MEFTITIARCHGAAPATPTCLRIGEGGCTLGRNPDNDLVLSDPERVISGRHVRLELREGAPWATDLSTNGTFLNRSSERLPVHEPVRLADGDSLTVGPYELEIGTGGWALGGGTDPARSAAFDFRDDPLLPGLPNPEVVPDILGLLTPAGAATPPLPTSRAAPPAVPHGFADALALDRFLGGPAVAADAALATPTPTPFMHAHFHPPALGASAAPAAALVPDDYDLLADGPGSHAADPFATPWAPVAGDASAMPPPVAVSAPVAQTSQPAPEVPERSPAPPSPVPSGSAAAGQQPWSPEPAPTADEPMTLDVPAFVPIVLPSATPAAEPLAGPGAALDTGLGAFLAGLGTGSAELVKDPHRFLHDAGRLLRELTQGLTATMQTRADFKSELRLGVTTIRAVENNPFKFSVGVDEALERLLFRAGGGFLPAVEAARGAFEDIQAHEMAMIAGLRAALRALLARFEPAELERRLGVASGLDKLLPMARRSRYWDLFTETYDQVAADASEDFMQLFGDAFTRAYEDQIHRLAQVRRRPSVTSGR